VLPYTSRESSQLQYLLNLDNYFMHSVAGWWRNPVKAMRGKDNRLLVAVRWHCQRKSAVRRCSKNWRTDLDYRCAAREIVQPGSRPGRTFGLLWRTVLKEDRQMTGKAFTHVFGTGKRKKLEGSATPDYEEQTGKPMNRPKELNASFSCKAC